MMLGAHLFGLPKVSQAHLELVAGGPAGGQWGVGGGPPVLSVYHGVKKPSMGQGFRVPKFQLSLVLHLSQVCLQHLSKVPDSRSSHNVRLCHSHHLDPPPFC
jgi:hypothetical protein